MWPWARKTDSVFFAIEKVMLWLIGLDFRCEWLTLQSPEFAVSDFQGDLSLELGPCQGGEAFRDLEK